jgi:signal peptidase I
MATGTEPAADRHVSDHYALLGVRPDASPQEIESAYRRGALELGYQDGAWRELRDAYDVLRDPEERAKYDAERDGNVPPKTPQKKSHNPVDRLFPNLPHGWRVGIDWVVTIAGAIAIVLAIKAWIVNPYRIPSSSMEPTLHCARPAQGCEAATSDRVLANRFIYHFRDPKRGEIVVFNTPKLALQACGSEGTFVKRLIGVPGDVWEERGGFVYINGKKLNEPYIKPERRDFTNHHPVKIDPRNYFMMGDNRASSCDSRVWGTVPRANIIGKVFAVYWPPNRIGFK